MRSLPEHMGFYGTYHRDARNRLTHFFGVPIIIFAILIPMSLARLPLGGVSVTLAEAFYAVMAVYYLWLDRPLGGALALLLLPLVWLADEVARTEPPGTALSIFAVVFIGGWALQLLGHRIEGNRPALLDNLFQILVAPIFLTAEAAFLLGWRPSLRKEVARRVRERDFPGAERLRPLPSSSARP